MVSGVREGGELMRGRGPWDRKNVGTRHAGGLPEVANDGRMKDKRVEREGGLAGRWVPCGVGQSAHLLEKQWAADTTQQVWMRLPAQKLFPM